MKLEQSTEYKLILSYAEIKWLQGVVQNPPPGVSPEDEDPYNRDMRSKFWNIMHTAEDQHPVAEVPPPPPA
jgi:hypothetical protein